MISCDFSPHSLSHTFTFIFSFALTLSLSVTHSHILLHALLSLALSAYLILSLSHYLSLYVTLSYFLLLSPFHSLSFHFFLSLTHSLSFSSSFTISFFVTLFFSFPFFLSLLPSLVRPAGRGPVMSVDVYRVLFRIYDKAQLLNKVNTLYYSTGGTNTALGFKYVAEKIYIPAAGDRKDANNTVIVITDGMPSLNASGVPYAVQALRNKGVAIIPVGVGSLVNEKFIRDISEYPQKVRQRLPQIGHIDRQRQTR